MSPKAWYESSTLWTCAIALGLLAVVLALVAGCGGDGGSGLALSNDDHGRGRAGPCFIVGGGAAGGRGHQDRAFGLCAAVRGAVPAVPGALGTEASDEV